MKGTSRNTAPTIGGPKRATLEPLAPAEGGAARVTPWFVVGVALLVAIVGIAAHGPALYSQVISFDDDQYLTENPLVRNPSWAATWTFLSEVLKPSTVDGYYQPLAMISLMLDVARGGSPQNLRPFHETSLALHGVCVALIVVLLYQLFRGRAYAGRTVLTAAALAALLFAVHPLTVEPIPWLGERKTMLATAFALASVVTWLRFISTRRGRWYAASLALFLLSLMSKPTTTFLPIALLLMDVWPLNRLSRRALLEKVPFLAIAFVSSLITYYSQKVTAGATLATQHGPMRAPLTLCHNIVFYLWKTLCPIRLSSHYPFPEPFSLANGYVMACAVIAVLLLAALAWSWRRTRALVIGWGIWFVLIFPTLGLIGFTNVIASDKYMYLPLIGFLMIVVWALLRLGVGAAGGGGRNAVILAVVLILAGAEFAGTRHYLSYWTTTERLFERFIALAPRAPSLYTHMGLTRFNRGDAEGSIPYYRKALELWPTYPHALSNLGASLAALGRTDEAIEQYRAALRAYPKYSDALNNLGAALLAQNRYEEAIECHRRTLEWEQRYVPGHMNLGIDLVAVGRVEEGLHHLAEAARLMPGDPEVQMNWGNGLLAANRAGEAVQRYEQALRIKPDYASALNNLSVAQQRLGRFEDAARSASRAVMLAPDYADAYVNLGAALINLRQNAPAAEAFRAALRINPDSAMAQAGLAHVLRAATQPAPSAPAP